MFGLDLSQIKRILGVGEARDNFDGLLPQERADYVRGFLMGGMWVLTKWMPRHFEMARVAHLFTQAARKLDISPTVFESSNNEGMLAYLLSLEGLTLQGVYSDTKAIDIAQQYEEFRHGRPEEGRVGYTLGRIEQRMSEKDRLAFFSWPYPHEKDQDHDFFIDTISKNRPDMVIVATGRRAATEELETDLTKIGYEFELGWKGLGWNYFGDQLKDKNHGFHSLVECYSRDGLNLKLPARVDEVGPYPWEKALPAVEMCKMRGFYKLRKGKFKRG